jgi:hypothetical protein
MDRLTPFDPFALMLAQLGVSMEQLKAEALKMSRVLAIHFGETPAWFVSLVLCYAVALYGEAGQSKQLPPAFYRDFFLYCVDQCTAVPQA